MKQQQTQPQEQLSLSSDDCPVSSSLTARILDVDALDEFWMDWMIRRLWNWIFDPLLFFPSQQLHRSEAWKKPWIDATIRIIAILSTYGQTPAVRLLGLQRTPTTNDTSHNMISRMQCYQRLFQYATVSVLLPTFYQVFRDWVIHRQHEQLLQQMQEQTNDDSADDDDDNDHDHDHDHYNTILVRRLQLAHQRQLQMGQFVLTMVDRMVPVMRMCALLACWNQWTTTPDLAMLCTGWTYQLATATIAAKQPTSNANDEQQHEQQQPSKSPPLLLFVDYAHRRWLWEEMFATARILWQGLILVPAVWPPLVQTWLLRRRPLRDHYHVWWQRWRQRHRRILNYIRKSSRSIFATKSYQQQQRPKHDIPCPICQTYPIAVPFQVDCCGYWYCYVCLYQEAVVAAAASNQTKKTNPAVYCRHCYQIIHKAIAMEPKRSSSGAGGQGTASMTE